jgi:hypothetical protein
MAYYFAVAGKIDGLLVDTLQRGLYVEVDLFVVLVLACHKIAIIWIMEFLLV